MQTVGTGILRLQTCLIPSIPFLPFNYLDCREDDSMLVLASAAKGGSVLAAKFSLEVGQTCSICVGSGMRSRAGVTKQ